MPHPLITDIPTAIVVFAATNIDEVLLMVGFFAHPRYRSSHVVAGQYLGMAVLFAVSAVASLISLVVAPAYVGLLGIVPIALGIRQWLQGEDDDDAAVRSSGGTILAVTSITIANGADNIGVYVPLFATLSGARIALYGAVFAALTACLCWFSWRLVTHPAAGELIRRHAHRWMPLVFIALGVMILFEAGTFSLLY